MDQRNNLCKYHGSGYQCSRPKYNNSDYCFFHSTDIETKKQRFDSELKKEIERQKNQESEYDFAGFKFPNIFDIKNYFPKNKIDKPIYIWGATFYKKVIFSHTEFENEVNFLHNTFIEGADFQEAIFNKEASFLQIYFEADAMFWKAKFYGETDFNNTSFKGLAHFNETEFYEKVSFSLANFKGKTFFTEVIFVKEVDVTDTRFTGKLYGFFESIEKCSKEKALKKKYKLIKEFNFLLSTFNMQKYPYINRYNLDQKYLKEYKRMKPRIYKIWEITCDCGRSFSRWALWCLLFALLFAFVYQILYFSDPSLFTPDHISSEWPGLSFIYYSVVTFTTLGFGDIVPNSGWIQLIVMVEVILGYIGLGGLISILATKLARRS